MKYSVIYDGGEFIDGIDGYETIEAAKSDAKEILSNWMFQAREGWKFTNDFKPDPTEEQIEDWDNMIEECEVYVTSGDDDCDRFYFSEDELEEIGWMYWKDFINKF